MFGICGFLYFYQSIIILSLTLILIASHSRTQAAASRRIWFDRRRVRHNKFAEQHNKDPAFFRHEKHVFILSFAGRPIFSRYGDETLLAAYMGVISAIIRYGSFSRVYFFN